ncbi:MAG: hypothetical protein ACRC7O_04075, partial [Fimbriiglobus sp.]
MPPEPDLATPFCGRRDVLLALLAGLVPVVVMGGYILFDPSFDLVEDDGFSIAQPLLTEGMRQMYSGRLPLWTDHHACGATLAAAPAGQGLFYPPHHVAHLLGVVAGVPNQHVQTYHLLHAGLAAAMAVVYLRGLRVGRPAAFLGAVPVGLNGTTVGMFTNWNDGIIWQPYIPLLFLVTERLLAGDRRWVWPAVAGLCVAMLGLASGPVGLAKVGIFTGMYLVLRANRRFLPFAVGRFALAGGLGLLGCAVQLVPTLEWIGLSTRVQADGQMADNRLFWLACQPEFYRGFAYPFGWFRWPNGFNAVLFEDGMGRFPGEAVFAGPLAPLALLLAVCRYAWSPGPARVLT